MTLHATENLDHIMWEMFGSGGVSRMVNRCVFEDYMDLCLEDGNLLGVLLAEVDNFEAFVESHGPAEGYKCLDAVTGRLMACAENAGAVAATLGGEMFVIVLADRPEHEVLRLADNLLVSVRTLAQTHDFGKEGVTMSIGAACSGPLIGETREEILQAAGDALYDAQLAGQNRWVEARENDAQRLNMEGWGRH